MPLTELPPFSHKAPIISPTKLHFSHFFLNWPTVEKDAHDLAAMSIRVELLCSATRLPKRCLDMPSTYTARIKMRRGYLTGIVSGIQVGTMATEARPCLNSPLLSATRDIKTRYQTHASSTISTA